MDKTPATGCDQIVAGVLKEPRNAVTGVFACALKSLYEP